MEWSLPGRVKVLQATQGWYLSRDRVHGTVMMMRHQSLGLPSGASTFGGFIPIHAIPVTSDSPQGGRGMQPMTTGCYHHYRLGPYLPLEGGS
jgi:hypothetical protein